MQLKSDVIIFTDGASRGNPGPGGFGAIIVKRDDSQIYAERTRTNAEIIELGGREKHTTNNRMELRAAIDAISFLSSLRIKDKGLRISVYTDSAYLLNGITRWIYGWQKNGWKTADKKDVENRDLWEKLIAAAEGKEIGWKKVDGHSGVVGNVRCDEIATAFADGTKPKLYSGVLENYRIKNIWKVAKGGTAVLEKDSTLKRARTRAKAYSYVSQVNGAIQTDKTWAECEKRVKGARGAKYQKVFSPAEEAAIIKNWR